MYFYARLAVQIYSERPPSITAGSSGSSCSKLSKCQLLYMWEVRNLTIELLNLLFQQEVSSHFPRALCPSQPNADKMCPWATQTIS